MVRALYMRESDLLLGTGAAAVDFAIQATGITLTPDQGLERLNTLKKAGKFVDMPDPEWSLEINFAVMMTTTAGETSLFDYLLEHNTEEVDCIYRPESGGDGYSFRVKLATAGIGGDQGAFATQSVTLGVIGQPVKVPAEEPAAG